MPKTNLPSYRHHKASGQAFIELGGRRFYLGVHGSMASREEYERRLAEYLANGSRRDQVSRIESESLGGFGWIGMSSRMPFTNSAKAA